MLNSLPSMNVPRAARRGSAAQLEVDKTRARNREIANLSETAGKILQRLAKRYRLDPEGTFYRDIEADLLPLVFQALTTRDKRRSEGQIFADDQFQKYLEERVGGLVKDHFRSADPLSRDSRTMKKRLDLARAALARAGREATEEALAEEMGVSIEAIRDMQMVTRQTRVPKTGDLEEQLTDLPTSDLTPEELVMNMQEVEARRTLLARLTPQHREVLSLLLEGRQARDIAKELGVHESRVSQIKKRALAELEELFKQTESQND